MNYGTVDNIHWPDENEELRDVCDFCPETFPIFMEELTEIDGQKACTRCYNKIIHLVITQNQET